MKTQKEVRTSFIMIEDLYAVPIPLTINSPGIQTARDYSSDVNEEQAEPDTRKKPAVSARRKTRGS